MAGREFHEHRRSAATRYHAARRRVRLQAVLPQVLSTTRDLHPILPVQAVVHTAICIDGLRSAQVAFEPARRSTATLAIADHALDCVTGQLDCRLTAPADRRASLMLARHQLAPSLPCISRRQSPPLHTRSNTAAIPCPPPMHMVTRA